MLVTVIPGLPEAKRYADEDKKWSIYDDHFIGYHEWPWFTPSIRDGVRYTFRVRKKKRYILCDAMLDFEKNLIYVKYFAD